MQWIEPVANCKKAKKRDYPQVNFGLSGEIEAFVDELMVHQVADDDANKEGNNVLVYTCKQGVKKFSIKN